MVKSLPGPTEKQQSNSTPDLLAHHLGNRHNALDLLRLLAASLVILGHSYAVVAVGTDPMVKWNGFTFSGGFALHVFFFLSGMLVTWSFWNRPDLIHWFASRALRVVPGLFVCLTLLVFVMGSLATTLPLRTYLTNSDTWDYFFGNLTFGTTRYYLPGVFTNHPTRAINGVLWSLYLEVRLYLGMGLLLWVFRRFRREWVTLAILCLAALGLHNPSLVYVYGENGNHLICSGLFLTGALCALWSDKIAISLLWPAILLLAANHYVYTPAFPPLFFFFVCAFVLWFGYSRWLSKIHLPGDYSYGMYIYGWPVQQLMNGWFPHWPPAANTAASLAGTLVVSAASWHLVEKRCLAYKRWFSARRSEDGQERTLDTKGRLTEGAWRPRALVLAGAALMLLISVLLPALRTWGAEPVQIKAYGPETVSAGKGFNVQANGRSALWVQLRVEADRESAIVFRGKSLPTTVRGAVLTAYVPDDLFKDPGDADVYIESGSVLFPSKSMPVRVHILPR